MTQAVHIAFTFDQNYLVPFYVSATSICKNNPLDKLVFHVVAAGVGEGDYQDMTQYLNYLGAEICFYKLDEKDVAQFEIPSQTYFTKSIFFRLILPTLVPREIGRLIYLDADTITIGPIDLVYRSNLGSKPVGAVMDKQMDSRSDIGITNKADYFNSGVLLIDLEEWRTQEITSKTCALLQARGEAMLFPDQDALNIVLRDNWFELGPAYNLMAIEVAHLNSEEKRDYVSDKVIVHYNDWIKPWTRGIRHPLSDLFDEYYAAFTGSPIAAGIIAKRMDSQLIHLIKNELTMEENDHDTNFLIGLALHLCWIEAIDESFPAKQRRVILKGYFGDKEIESRLMESDFSDEFEVNKTVLAEVHECVTSSAISGGDIGWIETWMAACRSYVDCCRQRQAEDVVVDWSNIVPDAINREMRISKPHFLLLSYFISRLYDAEPPKNTNPIRP
ncbi:MAG TPA: glycosyltransferase family 8 protein [Puia sp.]|jgi:UDP-glucose:(galactosyl)LPS alpha-1,2-glucosyltransferase|nr:glycosyltransferase family 8 protein [Puia sp.]